MAVLTETVGQVGGDADVVVAFPVDDVEAPVGHLRNVTR
jgi:hypothetical protein